MAGGTGLVRGLCRLLINRQTPLSHCQATPKFSTCLVSWNEGDATSAAISGGAGGDESELGVQKLTSRQQKAQAKGSGDSSRKEQIRGAAGVNPEQEEKSLLALATSALDKDFQVFPDGDTADQLFNGIKYKDLPYVYIRCTAQNSRIAAYTADHKQLWYTTCVAQGFPHAKKKSSVAAQAIGLAMGQKLRTMNQRTVRVRVDGFNIGRVPAVQGLTQAGLTVASVSDCTYIDWIWARRPKKRKRV